MDNVIVQWFIQNAAIPGGITLGCLLVARFFPKKKALGIAGNFRRLGRLLSKIGNTKLGKKSMSKLEEGPIATFLGFIGMCISEFSAGLAEDNVKEDIKKKLEKTEMGKAFDQALKKSK